MHQISKGTMQLFLVSYYKMIEWISRKYSVHSKMVCTCWCIHSHKNLWQGDPTNPCWFYCSCRTWSAMQHQTPYLPHMLSNLIQTLLFLSSTTLNSTSNVNYVLFLFSSLQLVLIFLHHGSHFFWPYKLLSAKGFWVFLFVTIFWYIFFW